MSRNERRAWATIVIFAAISVTKRDTLPEAPGIKNPKQISYANIL